DDSAFQSRFIQEARAAARLADPHVVNVFDQGQDGELAYLVMEYLPGITLRELLREQKRLTIPQTITIMDAVLAGLAAAHRAGIVHRDVKPENVLLAEDGRIKIGDFGLARATTANTATGQQLLGTIAYLAPELVTRGTADARSDIYALGIMLYEMLVGEQPYKGEQPMQIAFQHATESVPRPSVRNPGVPEQLDELVLWATEKSPDERPDDAQQMLDRLREIERGLGIAPAVAAATASQRSQADSADLTKVMPGTMVIADPAAPASAAVDNATLLRRRSSRRRARGAFLLTLVLLLATVAGGVGWWFGSGPGSLVAVPGVAGQSYEDAAAALTAEGFVPVRGEENSIDVARDETIRTDPEEGERLDKGTEVTVYISIGPSSHTAETLNGKSEQEARDYLSGIQVNVTEDPLLLFSDADAGRVINAFVTPRDGGDAYSCAEGCELLEDDTVELYVSAGPFPDVTGLSIDQATTTLTDKQLEVSDEIIYDFSESLDKDLVLGVADRATEGNWRPGDTVQLIVSKGPELFDVPDVTNRTLVEAKQILEEAGFTAGYAAWGDLPGFGEMAQVTAQDPGSDKQLPRGGKVQLSIQLSG
ncbi:protein kinase, partial [Microbacterium sp. ISL-103]|uniref:protein kinase domain-containing protein n=1 Tax=Microbacterium sp. ISL-103 TaxID=2819156 RepID=UPI001BE61ED9